MTTLQLDELRTGKDRFCHVSRRLQRAARPDFLHDADHDAGVLEKVVASAGCWNVLVVTGSAAEEVAKFTILTAKSVHRLMLLEAAHTSDAPLDPALALFKSIVQSCLQSRS